MRKTTTKRVKLKGSKSLQELKAKKMRTKRQENKKLSLAIGTNLPGHLERDLGLRLREPNGSRLRLASCIWSMIPKIRTVRFDVVVFGSLSTPMSG